MNEMAMRKKEEIMQQIVPAGSVDQAGTLSVNPLAMTAGISTLEFLQKPGIWNQLETGVAALTQSFGMAAERAGIPIQQTAEGQFTEAVA